MSRPVRFLVPLVLLACTSDLVFPPDPDDPEMATPSPDTTTTTAPDPPAQGTCVPTIHWPRSQTPGSVLERADTLIFPIRGEYSWEASRLLAATCADSVGIIGTSVEARDTIPESDTLFFVLSPREPGYSDVVAYSDSLSLADTVTALVNRAVQLRAREGPRTNFIPAEMGDVLAWSPDDLFYDEDGDSIWFIGIDSLNVEGCCFFISAGGDLVFDAQEEVVAKMTVTVTDGWLVSNWGLWSIRVGCPDLDKLPADTPNSRIVVEYSDAVPLCDRRYFEAGVDYWESVIAGDHRTITVTVDMAERGSTALYTSGDERLPSGASHSIGMDRFVWAESGYKNARRTIGWTLGLSYSRAWMDLVRNPAKEFGSVRPPDTYFAGRQAYREFVRLGGAEFYPGAGVPLSNGKRIESDARSGRNSRSDGPDHMNRMWRYDFIGNDLFSHDCARAFNRCPIGAITLGALADIGYTVDMNMAEDGTRIGW